MLTARFHSRLATYLHRKPMSFYHLLVTLIDQTSNHKAEDESNILLGNFGHIGGMNFFKTFRSMQQKWNTRKQDFKVGDIVLLKEDFGRNKWPMARVVKIEPDLNLI